MFATTSPGKAWTCHPQRFSTTLAGFQKLPVSERIAAMKRLNQDLMEYLHDVGQDSRIRQ